MERCRDLRDGGVLRRTVRDEDVENNLVVSCEGWQLRGSRDGVENVLTTVAARDDHMRPMLNAMLGQLMFVRDDSLGSVFGRCCERMTGSAKVRPGRTSRCV